MITMEILRAMARSEVTVKDKKQVTFVLDPNTSARVVVRRVEEYFESHDKQQAVKVALGSEELGYLLRTDLYNLVSFGTRAIGDSDGASLPGTSPAALIELCCPTAGCNQVMVVTGFDKNDPPTCDEHGTVMEPCQ